MFGRSLGLVGVSAVVGFIALGCGGGPGGKGTAGHDGGAGHGAAGAGGSSAGVGGGTAGGSGGGAGVAGGTAGAAGGAAGGAGGAAGAAGAAGADAGIDASGGDAQDAPVDGALGGDVADAAGADASGYDGPFAHGPANLCGSAINAADPIQTVISTGTYQDTAAGGQITPGVYWRTAETIYAPIASQQVRDTIYFYAEGTFQEVLQNGATQPVLIGGTWSIVGTALHLPATCPEAVAASYKVTATDSMITMFDDADHIVWVYTRH
jgi:hypothetical protein